MKRILCFSIALMMTLTLMVGCGQKSSSDDPSSAVKTTLTALKDFDTDKISKSITGSTDMFNESEGDETFAPIFSDMKFKITDTEVDGDKAVATVELEMIDFTEFIGFMMQEAIALSFSGLDEDAVQKELTKKIEEAIKDNQFNSAKRTVEINCKKVDGEWKVVADETLTKAIFGDALSNLGESFNMN
ncbi:lipoprotein [Oceanirhabdus seepicola]|uniref:DUF4878 domain-containing protein n=1 Tax=Oceanirhabdus seepicola TaxID=2828781 RepID=A0A9J6P0C3_9CLOT|nr:hypothetical protein [Oceanirhabdus seepicola]MCM1989987.1 hypothetical protein [Oceanirhabdus seepicola]